MRYRTHLFVCTNRRDPDAPRGSCAASGSVELRAELKRLVKSAGLKSEVRVNASGCLDLCELGPVAVSYPEGRWYSHLDSDDVQGLMESEIEKGVAYSRKEMDHPRFRLESPESNERAPLPKTNQDEE